jgi:hypothetical protein
MSNKTGRNELCPCGSGRKYKKCCLKGNSADEYGVLRKYDRIELVSFLASLLLLPINQSKQIRIEKAVWDLLSDYQPGNVHIANNDVIQDVNTSIRFCTEEDPVENLFTQNVMFYGGNYTVYPGISSDSVNQLQMILDSIGSMKDDIDNNIVKEMFTISLCMLKLSNSVADEIGHNRYMSCVQDHRNPLVGFSNQSTCNEYMDAICFPEERLRKLGIVNCSVFKPFIFKNEDLSAHEYKSIDNVLCSKPLYQSLDSLIVLFPSLITEALKRYLLSSLENHSLYRGMILNSLMRQTSIMHKEFCDKGYQHVSDVVEVDGDADIHTARIYRIDIDKYLAHVILSSYGGYGAAESCNRIFQTSRNTLDRVYRDVENSIKESNAEVNPDYIVVLISGLYFGCELYSGGTDPIVINLADLYLILRSDKLNQLSFWKYKKALNTLPFINPGLSFWALWYMYNDNDQTLYISDEEKPSLMHIDYSLGIDYKCDVYSSSDFHLALDTTHRLTKVIKHSIFYDNRIYSQMAFGSSKHFLLIDGYDIPIWITIDDSTELKVLKIIVAEAIAYWLWKMGPILKTHISSCGLKVIDLFLCSPEEENNRTATHYPAVGSIEGISVNLTDSGIGITLSSDCQKSFVRSDNIAECELMKEVIVNLLLLASSDPSIADSICSQVMSDGKAKMIHISERNDVFSILTDCSWVHQLHDTDIDLLLDDVAKEISSSISQEIDLDITNDKILAINHVLDHYLSMLYSRIEGCNVRSLIEALMGSHEALIFIKRKKTWLSSSIRHCYPEVFPKHQRDIIDIDNSMRAIRFLIEFSMHTPSTEFILSNDSIEELLAICHHIISFGIKKDIIRSNLWEIRIDKLASGRLGIVEESESYGRFVNAKQKSLFEYYERSYIDEYGDISPNNEQNTEFNKAMFAEYGINCIDIESILYHLEKISRSGSSSVICMKSERLKAELQKSGMACDKVDAFLNMFVLEQRDSWESLPIGFARKEIEPWHHKRRLSLAFKPIISQQDDIIIGVKTLFQSYLYLLTGIHNGRIREDLFKSTEMKAYSESIINQLSHDFVDIVQNRISELNPDMIIAGTDLVINKNGDIDTLCDLGLGDIDILAYDNNRKIVYSIECKRINFGRTPTEIRNERERFIRDSRNQSSWISKHLRRHQWMSYNKEAIRSYLELEDTDFTIQSFVVVSEDIALRYLESTDISIVTLDELTTML